MMTDDMIRSMKKQMVPSDEVVADLLANIAALSTSPKTSEHVVSFDDGKTRRACGDLTVSQRPAAKAKKSTTKSIWYYSTAAVAGVIVLLSVFTVFGSSSGNRAWDFIHTAIDNPTVVTSPDDRDRNAVTGSDTDDRNDAESRSDDGQDPAFSAIFSAIILIKNSHRLRTETTLKAVIRQVITIRQIQTRNEATPILRGRIIRRLLRQTMIPIFPTVMTETAAAPETIPAPLLLRHRMTATAIMSSVTAR